jgi:predicted ferric reductase
MKKKIRIGLIVFAVVLIIAQLTIIDYSNLTWYKTFGSFSGIIGMILLIISMIMAIRYNKKQQANLPDNR